MTDCEELARHVGPGKRREWASCGAWLYPGDRIVVLRPDSMLGATPAQVATILRSVMLAREPICARRIELLTGYSPALIHDVLTLLQASWDVKIEDGDSRTACWVVTDRWRYDG